MPPLLGEAADPADLPAPMTAALAARLWPVAALEGQIRALATDDPTLTAILLEGSLRAVVATGPVCRLILAGPTAGTMALRLGAAMRLAVEEHSLAVEALAMAGQVPDIRPLGAPALPPTLDVDAGFAFVVAHLTGVILHHAPDAAADGGPEPVHQMRVALRRLRSAILLFRRAVACAELDDATARLKALGAVLGPPRDWDVFTQGSGRLVGQAFSHDKAVLLLLAAAERRRQAGYVALRRYLDSPAFRELGMVLATLALARPWQIQLPPDPEHAEKRAALQRASLADYAARALSRRLEVTIAPGGDLSALDSEALHDIRLHAKRLRYAAEFFAPLFPGHHTRRFLRRLSAVQERLGHLNDGSVAAELMADLPRGGPGRAYAIGVVRGFVAARSSGGRRKMEQSWQRFRKLEPFWH
jgi:CHAD domain-containing protein